MNREFQAQLRQESYSRNKQEVKRLLLNKLLVFTFQQAI